MAACATQRMPAIDARPLDPDQAGHAGCHRAVKAAPIPGHPYTRRPSQNARPNMDSPSSSAATQVPFRYGLEKSLGYLLNRTADIVSTAFVEILRKESISLQEWRVLTTLTDQDDQTLSELASHAGTELSYLSRVVANAESRGWVTRGPSPNDKRSTRVSITDAGRATVRLFLPQVKALESRWIEGLPAEDVDVLRRTLQALYLNVVKQAQEAPSMGRKLTVARRTGTRQQPSPHTKRRGG